MTTAASDQEALAHEADAQEASDHEASLQEALDQDAELHEALAHDALAHEAESQDALARAVVFHEFASKEYRPVVPSTYRNELRARFGLAVPGAFSAAPALRTPTPSAPFDP